MKGGGFVFPCQEINLALSLSLHLLPYLPLHRKVNNFSLKRVITILEQCVSEFLKQIHIIVLNLAEAGEGAVNPF